RAGAIDPDFGGDGLQGKADPERGAEELMQVRSMPANHGGGEKGSHDRADGGDSEPDGVAANHPLAMLRKFAPQRVPKRVRPRNARPSRPLDSSTSSERRVSAERWFAAWRPRARSKREK